MSERYFCVQVNEYMTDKIIIVSGVPQGAVLSPTLFAIYINDIPINDNKNKDYSFLFADDLISFNIYHKKGHINSKLNNYMSKIENWLSKWRLEMSPSKCSYMVFSKGGQFESFNIQLFGQSLPVSENTKFLGLRFGSRLSFSGQIEYLKDTCLKRLNILKIVSRKWWGLNIDTLYQIYNSLIRSVMEYSSITYCCFSITNLNKLKSIQNQAIRTIHKSNKFESKAALANISQLEDLEDRFDRLNLNYLIKCIMYENPIITELYEDYLKFATSRTLKYQTPFCKYNEKIKEAFN